MKKNNLNSFYEEIAQNKELQNEVRPIIEKMKDKDNGDLEKIVKDELISIATDYGFKLTLNDFLNEDKGSRELSLDELENVSGGIAAKPLMFTAITLLSLIGPAATSMKANAEDNSAAGSSGVSSSYSMTVNQDESSAGSGNSAKTQNHNYYEKYINQGKSQNHNYYEQFVSLAKNRIKANLESQNSNPTKTKKTETKETETKGTETKETETKETKTNKKVNKNAVSIGNKEYESLAQAIADAQNGDIITINEDITIDDGISIKNKNITLVANGERTIKRAKNYTSYLFHVKGGSTFNIGDDDAKNCLTIDGEKIGDYERERNSITMNKSFIKCFDSTVNIKNAKLCNNYGGEAVHASNSNVNISGKTEIFNNHTDTGQGGALTICGGKCTISGQTDIHGNYNFGNGGAILCFKGHDEGKPELTISGDVKIHGNGTYKFFYDYGNDDGGYSDVMEIHKMTKRGGGICVDKGKLTISENAKVYNNFASRDSDISLEESEFEVLAQDEVDDNISVK